MATLYPHFSQIFIDPVREFYEAFVIYTFFSLLILILGGEREIITKTCLDHPPMKHPIFILGSFLPRVDLSDPQEFLKVKRGILQYVWFKPLYCLGMLICQLADFSRLQFILVILYNVSVTCSLYNLALFWKFLYKELRPFHPWSKFLCVKLIIFVSYWQSMIIQGLNILGVLGKDEMTGYLYQNGILCLEMFGFAILHLVAFPWKPYSNQSLPMGARMNFKYALRDCFGGADLKWDSKQTLFVGSMYYNFRNFDPTVDSILIARTDTDSRMNRINHGVRFTNNGTDRYWVGYGSTDRQSNNNNNNLIPFPSQTRQEEDEPEEFEEFIKWDTNAAGRHYIPDDPNYPVSWDSSGYKYTSSMNRLREDVQNRISV